jgi:hypothetical protein
MLRRAGEVIGSRLPRRFLVFLACRLPESLIRTRGHELLGIGKVPLLVVVQALIQEAAAQKRQFLQSNAVLPRESEVDSYRKERTCAANRNAFKLKDTEFRDLAESFKDVADLSVNHKYLLAGPVY